MKEIIFLTLILFSVNSNAVSPALSHQQLAWGKLRYEAELPEPFGEFTAVVLISHKSKLTDISLVFRGREVSVDREDLKDIDNPGQLGLAIEPLEAKGGSAPSWVSLSFEYGVPYYREMQIEGGCGGSCIDWPRRYVIITIYEDHTIKVKRFGPEHNVNSEIIRID